MLGSLKRIVTRLFVLRPIALPQLTEAAPGSDRAGCELCFRVAVAGADACNRILTVSWVSWPILTRWAIRLCQKVHSMISNPYVPDYRKRMSPPSDSGGCR
jgi:hypothetical protein